ncbi:STAS domain-containing protein [Phytohabitans rumicis]|uniref:Anti-sigma factor antagonist n=1 Tax=Phytohabitans rumicis TaxID=1076125 RepID=A0A6V8LDS5_9ACTN|nr:STAS domain-containing protein [Phytohabitans rumicis]GFJ95383.1 hypothetical protein Prum_090250 [Phytohabitans rumicis]
MSAPFSPLATLAPLYVETSIPSPATARVAVAGEVDLATAAALRERLLRVLHGHSLNLLDVNLAGVTFMDCTGIGALIGVRNAAARAGCQVRVTDPQPIVRRVLEATGLLGVFTAPIEQPQRRPARSEYPLGAEPVPTAVTVQANVTIAA